MALQNYYESNKKYQFKELIQLLIQQGVNLNPDINDKNTPLAIAISYLDDDMVSYLLAKRCAVNKPTKHGKHSAALFKAVLIGSEPEILLLLKAGAVLDKHVVQGLPGLTAINPTKFQEVQNFCDNFTKAKQLFDQKNSKYEEFFKKASAANKKYFKELILHWSKTLDVEQREILADSPALKKVFGVELLAVLYAEQNDIAKMSLKAHFRNSQTLFKKYKDCNQQVRQHG